MSRATFEAVCRHNAQTDGTATYRTRREFQAFVRSRLAAAGFLELSAGSTIQALSAELGIPAVSIYRAMNEATKSENDIDPLLL